MRRLWSDPSLVPQPTCWFQVRSATWWSDPSHSTSRQSDGREDQGGGDDDEDGGDDDDKEQEDGDDCGGDDGGGEFSERGLETGQCTLYVVLSGSVSSGLGRSDS